MTHKDLKLHVSSDEIKSDLGPFKRLTVLGSILVVSIVWSYWPTIAALFREWQNNDDYSAGQLVPFVAIYLCWREREKLGCCVIKPCWWGIVLFFVAIMGWFFGLLFMFESAERFALVLTLISVVLTVFGWQVTWVIKWILIYLFLMVPFPGKIHNLIGDPLQGMATSGSVFLLEAFGVRVSQQGNVVMLNGDIPMTVAEACSGLRMLTAFIIVSGFIAYTVNRSWVQKAIVFCSSIPIAVICNIMRISITGILFIFSSSELAEKFFHDFAGLVMMPAAVILIFGELWLLDLLIVPDEHDEKKRQIRGNLNVIHRKNRGLTQR